jgi:RecB family exonuclease
VTPAITRRIRLTRTEGLRPLQRALAALCREGGPDAARRRAVLVPTRSAAGQLRRTLEETLRDAAGAESDPPALPDLLTRQEWLERLHAALPGCRRRLSAIEREALLAAAAADAVARGVSPPFLMRPGLLAEMLAFYEALLARQRSVDRLESLLVAELEPRVEIDRGAERLLRQTRFLVAAYRAYEVRLEDAGGLDDHRLRQACLSGEAVSPYDEMIVAVADRPADPAGGLYPADFDLLARMPGLQLVTIVATARSLAAGLGERLHQLIPDLEEAEWRGSGPSPLLIVPEGGGGAFTHRDREEELGDAARRFAEALNGGDGGVPPRAALVFSRPLPYVYLARTVFAGVRLEVDVSDALPLAAEPFAALLEQVFEAVLSRFGRASLIALLRSPHLAYGGEGRPEPAAIKQLDQALVEAGYAGNPRQIDALAEQWSGGLARAARAAASIARELWPLCAAAPVSTHLETILAFLAAHEASVEGDEGLRQRHLRARSAVLDVLGALRDAARRFHDPAASLDVVAAHVRRWIEAHTFAPRAPSAGVRLVDARAARYGTFDVVHLAGLVSGEWPEPGGREILYPPFLLAQLGWPADADRAAAARADFEDLLNLATRETSVSTFLLENDTLVEPSPFLDDLEHLSLEVRPRAPLVTPLPGDEGLDAGQDGPADAWARIRRHRRAADRPAFHGQVGATDIRAHSVSSIDRYLDCPFKYFAVHVLHLREDADEEDGLTPKARGIFVHDVFRAFFEEWQAEGGGALTARSLPAARRLFGAVAGRRLEALPRGEAAAERLRLLGSAAGAGLGEMVLEAEALRPAPVVKRLLEYPFDGEFAIEGAEGARRVRLRGKVDRVDLLADGSIRLIDYKTGRAPDAGRSIQLPTYLICAVQQLSRDTGRAWTAGEAFYLAFGERDPVCPVLEAGQDPASLLAAAQARLLGAVDAIGEGSFPPRPASTRLCASCGFRGVCRKDYVGVD